MIIELLYQVLFLIYISRQYQLRLSSCVCIEVPFQFLHAFICLSVKALKMNAPSPSKTQDVGFLGGYRSPTPKGKQKVSAR